MNSLNWYRYWLIFGAIGLAFMAVASDVALAQQEAEGVAPAVVESPQPLAPGARAVAGEGRIILPWYATLLIVVGVIAIPLLLAQYLAARLRMTDYGWKIGLALCTITAGTAITVLGWPPKLGTDLSGGVNLIYELDRSALEEGQQVDMGELVAAISERVNPGGVKEVTIRPWGADQVEIIIPRADDAEIALIKRKISTAGLLQFRITANTNDHAHIIALGQAQREKGARRVMDNGREVGHWVRLNATEFKPERDTHLVTRQNQRGEWEVLVITPGDLENVEGAHLASATSGIDERGRPAVNFALNSEGSIRFSRLTGNNKPNPATGFFRHLGIVLDDELRTAPRLNDVISKYGQISGEFDQAEVDFLISILNAGRLPAALNPTPISEEIISPTLGADTVQQGGRSIIISMIAVPLFMIAYYRFAGIVACVVLIANLILLLAFMITFKAAFTLPGLAGMALTVGMAVDANVLIYERIREELDRGAALRMAIRNGFSRATGTIIDSNLTTILTAIILYWIGTDQIRGFAVTLILGIAMSMFTAVFCARIIFDIAERKRWITKLRMGRILGKTNIDFMAYWRLATAASLVVIAVGLIAAFARGSNLFDIDFTGGTSVAVLFAPDQGMEIAQVRAAVAGQKELEDVAVVGVGVDNRHYKINTRNRNVAQVQSRLAEIFRGRLQMNSLAYRDLKAVDAAPPPAAEQGGVPPQQQPAEEGGSAPEASSGDQQQAGSTATLLTGEPIGYNALFQLIENALDAANKSGVAFDIQNPNYVPGSEARFSDWTLKTALGRDETQQILQTVGKQLAVTPVFPSSSNIGSQVAGDMQAKAVYALLASLLCIVGYVWLRFQHVVFGLAAVLALVHDVLVMLAALALSAYLATYVQPVADALLMDPFKINLPIVAAFLTIIGYSINDTIVLFDRIREVRGKSPKLNVEMINLSINQTLSRTILTALTVFLVVVILYVLGGAGIHGFAFALVVGAIAGTYSTVFIAAPLLLWITRSEGRVRKPAAEKVPAGALK